MKMLTGEEQRNLLRKAMENGVETYRSGIEEVGEYDREYVEEILSMKDFETMWETYKYSDTMVRDYIIDIIK